MSGPLVTAVIPVKDRVDSVLNSIRSAQRQSLAEIEILIVENNSREPDQIDTLVRALNDPRIHVVHCDPCANANVARNLGASMAKGAFVAYLDSDDEWEPWHLERAVAALNVTGADFFYGGMTVNDGRSLKVHRAFDLNGTDPGDYLLGGDGGSAPTCSYVMRRDVLEEVRWDESLRRHQDFDYFIRVCRRFASVASLDPVCRVNWIKGVPRAYCRDSMVAFYQKHAPHLSLRARRRFSYGKIKYGIRRKDVRLIGYFLRELVKR